MKSLLFVLSTTLLAASQPALAQLADPTRTRSTTQIIAPPPPPPPPQQVAPIRPPQPPPMRTDLGQRDQAPPVSAPAPKQAPQDEPAHQVGAPAAKVYDRNGRELTGMEQAGPDRVRDTRTGKYYDTVPMGDGQRIKR